MKLVLRFSIYSVKKFGPSVFYFFGPPDSVYRTSSIQSHQSHSKKPMAEYKFTFSTVSIMDFHTFLKLINLVQQRFRKFFSNCARKDKRPI